MPTCLFPLSPSTFLFDSLVRRFTSVDLSNRPCLRCSATCGKCLPGITWFLAERGPMYPLHSHDLLDHCVCRVKCFDVEFLAFRAEVYQDLALKHEIRSIHTSVVQVEPGNAGTLPRYGCGPFRSS